MSIYTNMKTKQLGFTLIELMVTVAIMGVLASIALPSYKEYVQKGRRVDAKDALTAIQLAEEKFRGNNTAYTTDLANLGLTATSTQKYYTLAVTAATGTSFTATATVNASSAQAPDATKCNVLVVTEKGFDAVNSSNATTCWGL